MSPRLPAPLWRTALAAASPAGARARLQICIFHRVQPETDPLQPGEVDAARFEQQCRWLSRWFRVLPLAEAVARLQDGTLPARAACITFDDGYADNLQIAAPILQRQGLPATFFIATGYQDGSWMWNDLILEAVRAAPGPRLDLSGTELDGMGPLDLSTLAARRQSLKLLLPRAKYLAPSARKAFARRLADRQGACQGPGPMLDPTGVQALASVPGMTIGAHTVTHPILARVSLDEAEAECRGSRDTLQALLQRPVRLFAYPNGSPDHDYGTEHAVMLQRVGFDAAVTTAPGVAGGGVDRYQLPRFTPWDGSGDRFALRLLRNVMAGRPLALARTPLGLS